MELVLSFPPSVNHYWGQKGKARFLTLRAKQFREEVLLALLAVNATGFPAEARLQISVLVQPPDNRVRDLDNLLKPLLDALEHAGAMVNDEQIDRIVIERGAKVSEGAAFVSLKLFEKEVTDGV